MKKLNQIIALANSSEPVIALENEIKCNPVFVFGNDAQIGSDSWALVAPLGEFPKDQEIIENGQTVIKKYLQVVDPEVVSEILANENTVIRRNLRSTVGLPVYLGHPDIALHNQSGSESFIKKLANIAKELWNLRKASAVGTISDFRRSDQGGLQTKITLLPEGAEAVANGHDKISVLWYVRPTGEIRDGRTVVRPFLAASIGLTPFPNISGADSLANAKPNTPAASSGNPAQTKTQDNTMKQLLIGWLAAQGIALANDATEQAVFDAFLKENSKHTSNITALGNEKTTLTQTVTTLTTDRDAQKKRADDAIFALTNEQTAFKAERKARCEAVVDLVIAQGKLDVAGRDQKITDLVALDNAKLATEIEALGKLPVKFKVGSSVGGDRKAGADNTRSASEQILALANEDARYKGKPFTPELYAKILADNPSLKEQLNATTAK